MTFSCTAGKCWLVENGLFQLDLTPHESLKYGTIAPPPPEFVLICHTPIDFIKKQFLPLKISLKNSFYPFKIQLKIYTPKD